MAGGDGAPLRTSRRWASPAPSPYGNGIAGLARAGAWCLVLCALWVTVARAIGWSGPLVTPVLEAIYPFVGVPLLPVSLGAVLGRRWRLAGAGAAMAAVWLGAMAPLLPLHSTTPSWAATAPRLRVYSANVLYLNRTPQAAIDQAARSGADVVALEELTPAVAQLARSGELGKRYPYQLLAARPGSTGAGLFSRLPLVDATIEDVASMVVPTATISVGGRSVTIHVVHTLAPTGTAGDRTTWRQELGALAAIARAHPRSIFVGDFNAGRWHPAFGRLLDSGLRDAHEATGRGLSLSWPADRWFGPFTRLDHALYHADAFAAVRTTDYPGAGSDHRAFEVELALR